jgi:IS605 OrfB family transposase
MISLLEADKVRSANEIMPLCSLRAYSDKSCDMLVCLEIKRTIRLKIDLDLTVAERTVQAWTSACNFISQVAFEHGCLSRAVELHELTYNAAREQFGLSAQITASAIRQVASRYTALRTKKITPEKAVHFRLNAVVLQGGERGRDFSFTETGLSVSTIDGRVKSLPFRGEPKLTEYLADWQLGDARLYVRRNKVYLSVSFKRDVPDVEKPNDAVIGVDRGINYLAVVTDGKRQRFFAGGRTQQVRERYDKTRASLQRKKAQKPTRSLRRALKRLSGSKARFMRDANHQVSKGIVEFARLTGNPTIAVEALDGIRDRSKRMRKGQHKQINSWAFYQLQEFLCYKAAAHGFEVLEIDPRNTSKGCSRCGYIDAANRHGHIFSCIACGYTLHADLNGSRNIRLRGLLARQDLGENGLSSVSPQSTDGLAVAGKLPDLSGSH